MIRNSVKDIITSARVVFLDFDGVIKDSVPVKTNAFRKLFSSHGKDVTDRVVEHHLANGGVSRYKKIPYYFKAYVGIEISEEELYRCADEFSSLVVNEVVSSPWITAADKYLRTNPFKQQFILVTGTPLNEIATILEKLKLTELFSSVHGAPEEKTTAVYNDLKKFGQKNSDCILIGDSKSDYNAARENGIEFIFRGEKKSLPNNMSSCSFITNFSGIVSYG